MLETKLNKQLEKLKKQHNEQKATYRREHYKRVSFPLNCPYCNRETNFNILYLHNKTARCKALKKLLVDGKPDLERNLLIKIDMLNKILLKHDKENPEIYNILNRILEADKPQLIDIDETATISEPKTY